MQRSPRWILALLILLCALVAPTAAPGSGIADTSLDPSDAQGSTTASTADELETRDALFDGIRFPGDDTVRASSVSHTRSAGARAAQGDREARVEERDSVGGGELLGFPPLSLDGTRVFPLAKGSFRISQEFGCVPFDPGYALSGHCPPDRPSFHTGVDLAAEPGTTIYAAATGTVVFGDVDRSNHSGNTVIRIIHDGPNSGYVTDYFHWQASYVEPGDRVLAGQPIGEVGSLGYSSEPHLHFSVFDSRISEYLEPLNWLRASESLPVAIGVGGAGGADGVMRWSPLIVAASVQHGIPAALIAAIITVESGGNPDAISPAGAQGLMQVMPMHLERFGIPQNQWLDPATNIDAGSRFLAELLAANGTLTNTVGAYFGHGCDVLGTCTREYIAAVYGWYNHYVPIFSSVAIGPGDFEFTLPDPGGSDPPTDADPLTPSPTAEPEPTATPEPEDTHTPEPSPSPTPEQPASSPEDDAGDPVPTPGPSPTPSDPDGGSDAADDATDDDEGVDTHEPAMVKGHDSYWILYRDAGAVLRVNPEDDRLIAIIELDAEPYDIAVSSDSVWVSVPARNVVVRIDPKSNSIVQEIEFEAGPRGLLGSDEKLWIGTYGDQSIVLFDVAAHTVVEVVAVGVTPCRLTLDDGVIVVSSCDTDEVVAVERDELSSTR